LNGLLMRHKQSIFRRSALCAWRAQRMLTKEGELAAAINLLQAARNSLGDTASQRLNKSTRLDSRKTIIQLI
jgi:hypothetical protein